MSERSERNGTVLQRRLITLAHNSALLSERSERKGHRPPETGLG
ncbi:MULTISPECIES: hypothetical protein [Methanosarcina]|nr:MULTISPECIES: hypothetical protein [Methanosarcina]